MDWASGGWIAEGWSTDSCKNFFGQIIESDARDFQNTWKMQVSDHPLISIYGRARISALLCYIGDMQFILIQLWCQLTAWLLVVKWSSEKQFYFYCRVSNKLSVEKILRYMDFLKNNSPRLRFRFSQYFWQPQEKTAELPLRRFRENFFLSNAFNCN